ncbi:DUF308 domain-containing protein [uncultured Thomasclavelia sp.]|uniref:DUF308 domain-containing protein n=1 Tax=uncultured Thomasclavelia sp. TaxID=3025759 RepID=UPI0035A5FB0F
MGKGGSDENRVQVAKTGYYLISIVFYCLGIILLMHPFKISASIGILCSCLLIFYGIVKIVGYFWDDL